MSFVYSPLGPFLKDIQVNRELSKDIQFKYIDLLSSLIAIDHNISYILGDLLRLKKETITPHKIRGKGENKYSSPILAWC